MLVSPGDKQKLIALAAAVALCFAAWVLGGALAAPNLDWYGTLNRPSFAPPNSVFSVVWTLLYAMMVLAAWQFWRSKGKHEDRRRGLICFSTQLALNVAWSFSFFWLRSPAAGFFLILLLLLAIAITIVVFDRLSRPAALLLVPYLLWVCFAAALNFAFWFLNR
jgi:translocator protein